jgi:hypothetical protein
VLNASERKLRATKAVETSWAKTEDRSARTAPARAANRARFEREVDPEGKLDPADRARRAEHARRAWYSGLALKSAKSRRLKREARKNGNGASS